MKLDTCRKRCLHLSSYGFVNDEGVILMAYTQDGKPYIQLSAGHVTHADPRSRGYTFVARTVFLSKEDMAYYDEKDEKHGEIKSLLKGKVEDGPPLVVVMDG